MTTNPHLILCKQLFDQYGAHADLKIKVHLADAAKACNSFADYIACAKAWKTYVSKPTRRTIMTCMRSAVSSCNTASDYLACARAAHELADFLPNDLASSCLIDADSAASCCAEHVECASAWSALFGLDGRDQYARAFHRAISSATSEDDVLTCAALCHSSECAASADARACWDTLRRMVHKAAHVGQCRVSSEHFQIFSQFLEHEEEASTVMPDFLRLACLYHQIGEHVGVTRCLQHARQTAEDHMADATDSIQLLAQTFADLQSLRFPEEADALLSWAVRTFLGNDAEEMPTLSSLIKLAEGWLLCSQDDRRGVRRILRGTFDALSRCSDQGPELLTDWLTLACHWKSMLPADKGAVDACLGSARLCIEDMDVHYVLEQLPSHIADAVPLASAFKGDKAFEGIICAVENRLLLHYAGLDIDSYYDQPDYCIVDAANQVAALWADCGSLNRTLHVKKIFHALEQFIRAAIDYFSSFGYDEYVEERETAYEELADCALGWHRWCPVTMKATAIDGILTVQKHVLDDSCGLAYYVGYEDEDQHDERMDYWTHRHDDVYLLIKLARAWITIDESTGNENADKCLDAADAIIDSMKSERATIRGTPGTRLGREVYDYLGGIGPHLRKAVREARGALLATPQKGEDK